MIEICFRPRIFVPLFCNRTSHTLYLVSVVCEGLTFSFILEWHNYKRTLNALRTLCDMQIKFWRERRKKTSHNWLWHFSWTISFIMYIYLLRAFQTHKKIASWISLSSLGAHIHLTHFVWSTRKKRGSNHDDGVKCSYKKINKK